MPVEPFADMALGEHGAGAGSEIVEQGASGSLDRALLRFRRELPDYGADVPRW